MNETNEQKLRATVEALSTQSEKTLIAPDYMKSPIEAKAYMQGATAAFKQMADMAHFCLSQLDPEE